MKRPEFTDEEQYLINFYKSRQASGGLREALWQDLAYIIPALVFVFWGVSQSEGALICIGFCLLLFFKLRELVWSAKWSRCFGTIFQKYDDSFRTQDEDR